MVLMAAIGNALLTGGLSEVQNRYAARLAWLLPFMPFLVIAARARQPHGGFLNLSMPGGRTE